MVGGTGVDVERGRVAVAGARVRVGVLKRVEVAIGRVLVAVGMLVAVGKGTLVGSGVATTRITTVTPGVGEGAGVGVALWQPTTYRKQRIAKSAIRLLMGPVYNCVRLLAIVRSSHAQVLWVESGCKKGGSRKDGMLVGSDLGRLRRKVSCASVA